MRPAHAPRYPRDDVRLLIGPESARGQPRHARVSALTDALVPGDLVVLNDASTLPGSLEAHLVGDEPSSLELRLTGPPEGGRVRAVLFGPGDWRLDTDERPAPPTLSVGDVLQLADGAPAHVVAIDDVHPRLLELDLGPRAWRRIYRWGRPVQYRHLDEPLAMWAVQTLFAGPPWAAEMPSAGRPLSWRVLAALRQRGIAIATLTHAAGLSATGDRALDAALPLPERYRIPASTVEAIASARRSQGRVVAVGTTVVRALEDAHLIHGRLVAGEGRATLRIGPQHQLAVVDGLLTGMHAPGESHFELLEAFVPPAAAAALHEHAAHEGYLAHEFGDLALIWADPHWVEARRDSNESRPRSRCSSRRARSPWGGNDFAPGPTSHP